MYELGESQGAVSVFSSFNDSKDNDVYPVHPSSSASNPYVIVVAASDQYDTMTYFSNYGINTVTLAAPGMDILSTDTTGQGMYLPAATPDSNIMYESFEDGAPIVTIQQFDNDGNLVGEPGTMCTDTHYLGAQSLKVPVDTSVILVDDDGGELDWYTYQGIRIDIDLAKAKKQMGVDVIESLRQAQNLYLGFALTTAQEYGVSTIGYYVRRNVRRCRGRVRRASRPGSLPRLVS